MLLWIRISNYALIPDALVEFSPRFNVITGETGAGKSVLLGAIEALFGARADMNALRNPEARCEISGQLAVPELMQKEFAAICACAGVPFEPEEGTVNVKRIMTRSGARCFINDSLVTLATLKQITGTLAEIHTANSHQQLGGKISNLELIDKWAGSESMLEECRSFWGKIKDLEAAKAEMTADIPDRSELARLEALVVDVDAVAPSPGEDEDVDARHRLASDAQWIMESSSSICNMINSEGGAADIMSGIYRTVDQLSRNDSRGTAEMLEKCVLITENLRELAGDVEDYAAGIDLDEEAFRALEKRRSDLFALRRRYGMTIDLLLNTRDEAEKRCRLFYESESALREYDRRIAEASAGLQKVCGRLSALRREASVSFCREVQSAMAALGLERGRMEMSFRPCTPGENGGDDCEIIFAANPGSPLRSLRSVASSGELSRMLLAIKSVMAERDAIPVMIFDEIDANLGGETAHRVGDTLCVLSGGHQIIAISHLAQVAVRADRHFMVSKGYSEDSTVSCVETLERENRRKEVARMLGGGESAMQHAADLMKN